MRIFYLSDLHLEFYDGRKITNVTPVSKAFARLHGEQLSFENDVLVLAGDIGQVHLPMYQQFLKSCTCLCQNVLVLAGNHEFYTTTSRRETVAEIEKAIDDFCQSIGATFLNRSIRLINNVLFAGATLWYNVSQDHTALKKLNDYHHIYSRPCVHPSDGQFRRGWADAFKLQVADVASWNGRDVKFFIDEMYEAELTDTVQYVVCISHHPPTTHLSREDGYCNTQLQAAIVQSSKLRLWICGHNHQEAPVAIALSPSKMLACNTIGYKGEFPQRTSNFQDTKDLPELTWVAHSIP